MKNRLRRLIYAWRFDRAVYLIDTVSGKGGRPSDVGENVAWALTFLPKKYAHKFLSVLENNRNPND